MSDEIRKWLAGEALRLGAEVRDLHSENDTLKAELRKRALDSLSDIGQLGEQSAEIAHLKAEVERLEHQVKYWRIEAETDNARWLRSLEENERLRASSFVTAVPVEQYERLVKAGDWVMSHWSSGDGSDEVRFCQALLKWHAAKEGKPSV